MPKRILRYAERHIEDNPKLWRGIAIAAFCVAMLTVGIVFWQHMYRTPTRGHLGSITDKELTLSARSESDLWKMVQREGLVLGVQVVDLSLTKNVRKTIFFKSKVPEVQAAWDEYLTRRVPTAVPVFQASAPLQNDRIAQVLNGNFDCREFKKTITFTYVPDIDKYAPWVCTISVPPSFDASGDFSGILTMYLPRELSDVEKKNLAKVALELSRDIFHRDVENITSK